MKTKHTAGPWKHEGDGYITGIENDPANKCVGLVDIASVYLRTVPGRHDANARLIAAAPDLLEALYLIANTGMDARQCMLTASAAIAKATGEPA